MMQFQDLHPHTQSSVRFHLETSKGTAWRNAQLVATWLEGIFSAEAYMGPVVIAGGWVRDLALGRTPKDLDIFIDGGALARMDEAEHLAGVLSDYLGDGWRVDKTLPCYGNWAADLEKVVKIEGPEEGAALAAQDTPVRSIDLIVLSRAEMEKAGYRPSTHMSNGVRASFLRAVLERVDLRLNAIGSTTTGTDCASQWNEDALNERLVVQAARLDGEDSEIASRILARIGRHTEPEGKYAGWTVHRELPDGSLLVA